MRANRSTANSFFGWAFGISVTILFVSLWGRAVVVDSDSLAESLAPMAGSETVVDAFADWMSGEMIESGVDPALVDPTVEMFFESSAVGETLDRFVFEVVEAAASADPSGSSVDMRSLITPAVPEITQGLGELGLEVSDARLEAIVSDLDPLVIRQPGTTAFIGPNSPTASRLSTASLLAALGIALFGYLFVITSQDRVSGLRSLFTRVAVGGASFALFLRLGGWILDPERGRAPLPETLSSIATSKWLFPLQIAVAAGAVAALIWVVRRLFRPEEGSPTEPAPPRRLPERSASRSE